MLRHREFDVAEMSLSSYTVSLFREPQPFIAIPVFPSRFFRHSCIYVTAKSGIREPKDLIGKRIGDPEYQMTAPVWIRGILQDEYGVPVDSVDVLYRRRGGAGPRREDQARPAAEHPRARRSARRRRCRQMLRDGEIDALHTARMPSTYPPHAGRRAAPVRELRRRSSGTTTGKTASSRSCTRW